MDFENEKQLYLEEVLDSMASNRLLNVERFGNLNADSSFNSYKVVVEEMKSLFIKIKDAYPDNPSMKIKSYLIQLKDCKKSVNNKKDKFNILKKLIMNLEFPNFLEAYKNCFMEGLEILETNVDYFCSYTTRGLPAFNNQYRNAIDSQFVWSSIELGNLTKIHYVAKMIVDFFNIHGFNSFFDKTNMNSGDLIKDKVYNYCKKTAVFVQIIEQRSFYTADDEFNWSFYEYKTYKESVNLRYIFYKKEGLVRPQNASEDILNWYDFATSSEGVVSTTIHTKMSDLQIQDIVNNDAQIVKAESAQVFARFWDAIG